MLNRRTFLAAVALTATMTFHAQAADWSKDYPELVLGVIPSENASTTSDRYAALTAYLGKELGTKVTLRVANDYAAVIEGQRAGNIQIAFYGPASYARAVMTGVETTPLVNQRHDTGVNGYYSVVYVRSNSPYQKMEDLKGKSIALVDPNSTSGNNAPRYFLNRDGYSVDTFFGKNFFAGSHENAVLALAQGTADAAANSWNSEDDSNLTRMISRGVLKDADGKALTKEDFRIVFKSDFLPEGPFSVLNSLPDQLKADIKQAFLDMPKKDKAGFDALSDGKDQEFVATEAKEYEPIIEMLKFNDKARKS
ncbi:phosphonate ABC transporter substrate-binding protein [Ochrobactrum sp. RH2CCR150]|uniref:phosphonate ABC transporter substrate-binding protein n=1 Tax=Ochrobactrum sp. RH2CCR150 TaxID=2587044 RepID=UPI0015F7E8AB|nr:phosphonate transport system substrate-binding protein [Ochrobactrum sp. RH2CCR150]URQ75930.1 MAG: phosphonate ABC transporter substrate-binding protein [Candidatus Ochrobactrum gambitense]WEK15281.1 MAG: phosphonate ABC transporter substrate-binding protein [Candidatus Ochrobactrum gambitense]